MRTGWASTDARHTVRVVVRPSSEFSLEPVAPGLAPEYIASGAKTAWYSAPPSPKVFAPVQYACSV